VAVSKSWSIWEPERPERDASSAYKKRNGKLLAGDLKTYCEFIHQAVWDWATTRSVTAVALTPSPRWAKQVYSWAWTASRTAQVRSIIERPAFAALNKIGVRLCVASTMPNAFYVVCKAKSTAWQVAFACMRRLGSRPRRSLCDDATEIRSDSWVQIMLGRISVHLSYGIRSERLTQNLISSTILWRYAKASFTELGLPDSLEPRDGPPMAHSADTLRAGAHCNAPDT